MSTLARLVNAGKMHLGEDQVFACLSGLYNGLFQIIERGNYITEVDLLHALDKWANTAPVCSFKSSYYQGNFNVTAKIFKTHQKYVRAANQRKREFGDLTFVLLFSDKQRREAFANTFQLKVDRTIEDAYGSLFRAPNINQLNFYRTTFLETLNHPYDSMICDFLHYMLIDSNWLHSVAELPLSYTWLDDSNSTYWTMLRSLLNPRYITGTPAQSGLDTLIRKQFLTTGINVKRILELCTPSLRTTLDDLLEKGVGRLSTEIRVTPPEEDEPPLNKNTEDFIPPENPLSSSFVFATEISLEE